MVSDEKLALAFGGAKAVSGIDVDAAVVRRVSFFQYVFVCSVVPRFPFDWMGVWMDE